MQTCYELDDQRSDPVRFVQHALIGFLCADWSDTDRILIFYTEESHKKNWLDGGQPRIESDIERIGLESILSGMSLSVPVEGCLIKEGFTEEDIWSIFDTVYEKLTDGDEIYFDVTHAFRSIPLFSMVLFNYARFMKGTRLAAIYYGAFEKLGPAFLVKQQIPDPRNRVAPIIDLTSIARLQATNVAASDFLEFGKVGTIANQLSGRATSGGTGASRKTADALRVLRTQLANLDFYIDTCRIYEIQSGRFYKAINDHFNDVLWSTDLLASEKLLLRKIKEKLRSFGFVPSFSEANIKAAIRWALAYGMMQQTYTLGQEFIITKTYNFLTSRWRDELCDLPRLFSGSDSITKLRIFISGVLGHNPAQPFAGTSAEKAFAARLLEYQWMKDLKKAYDPLRNFRNFLNHGKGQLRSSEELARVFEQNYDACLKILKKAAADEA